MKYNLYGKMRSGQSHGLYSTRSVPLIDDQGRGNIITSKAAHHQVIGNMAFNHYSLLGAIEQVWDLGCLANTCGLAGVDVLRIEGVVARG